MIDDLLTDDRPIVIEDDASRRKLLRVIALRSEEVMNGTHYDTVHRLDRLYERVQRGRPACDSRDTRVADLQARREALRKRLDDVKEEKEAALEETRARLAERQSIVDEKRRVDEERVEELCPGMDDKRYSRWSRMVLDMRYHAGRYARAGEYETALTLRDRASEVEASEREAHDMNWSLDCARIRRNHVAHQEKVDSAFKSWCERQELKTNRKFERKIDRQIDALTIMIHAADQNLEILERPARK
jgi:hypothetical protein